MKTYSVFLDGKAWCATGNDFINLQESLAGFGDSPVAALECLIAEESMMQQQEGETEIENVH